VSSRTRIPDMRDKILIVRTLPGAA
jgi:hypothetical protein